MKCKLADYDPSLRTVGPNPEKITSVPPPLSIPSFSPLTLLVTILCAVVLLAFVNGCATTKQTEDLLSAAGFKTQPATTPEQQAHLKSLPAHTLTPVQRAGKQYFVYPDVAHNVLYIGQNAQYQEYKKLRQEQKSAAEVQLSPTARETTEMAVWGNW
jgi:hypothetical protein